ICCSPVGKSRSRITPRALAPNAAGGAATSASLIANLNIDDSRPAHAASLVYIIRT
ncbi:unnamed protein product, partial [Callosobruchus maculatus]